MTNSTKVLLSRRTQDYRLREAHRLGLDVLVVHAFRVLLITGALALALGIDAAAQTHGKRLTPGDLDPWFAHIAASPDELSWKRQIAWHQSFGPALARARKEKKPVLLYIAAGDPQGCT
jgi:hypothetical protein